MEKGRIKTDSLGIYIPSRARYDSKQDTIQRIPFNWLKQTSLVVPKNEADHYKRALKGSGVSIMKCPLNGIHNVRQWCLENSTDKYLLFLDDDMKFGVRTEGVRTVNADFDDVDSMFKLLIKWLDSGFMHVGISQRAGNNHVKSNYAETTRMNNAYAYNVKEFLKTGVRFDRLEVMEDFDVTLSLLKKGFNNRVTFQYAWSQRKSGDVGGCSIYRTSQLQKECALKLSKLHPGVVRVVEKTSKQRWEGMESSKRTDVVIQWKKAYKPQLNKNEGISRFIK